MPDPSKQRGMKIAVVGSGIAGLASAWLLSRRHKVTLFEAGNYYGGHSHTIDVTLDGQTHPVDLAFRIFNHRTYPNLIELFRELQIKTHESAMSFSVSIDQGRIEWSGNSLAAIFTQPGNLLRPGFIGMLRDIRRFNRQAVHYRDIYRYAATSLGELLDQEGYGPAFRNWYLLPMAAAIWSSPFDQLACFPASTFLNFYLNHGLCTTNTALPWKIIDGGARTYVERMLPSITEPRLECPVSRVMRQPDGVHVVSPAGDEVFDSVILACHAPDSLAMLTDASSLERQILSGVRYQKNVAYLHTDSRLLPQRRRIWSAWNCLSDEQDDGSKPVCISYLINKFQPLPVQTPLICTLNPLYEPRAEKILGIFKYYHPLFDQAAAGAQRLVASAQGKDRVWFAGAWTGCGFHEDGLRSALKVAADFNCLPGWEHLEE